MTNGIFSPGWAAFTTLTGRGDCSGAEQLSLTDKPSIPSPYPNFNSPVLTAHRGGGVGHGVPENSLSALELAAAAGRAMDEVDIRMASNGVPVAFHGGELLEHAGSSGSMERLSFSGISKLRYLEGFEGILSLDEYLRRAAALDMAIMLDIKTEGNADFFAEVKRILASNQLNENTLTIARSPSVRAHLGDSVIHPVGADQEAAIEASDTLDLPGKFWFGWPCYIINEPAVEYQTAGALVAPSINVFHYPESEHRQRAEADIRRVQDAGVRFFQIDSVYDVFLN